MKMRAWLFAQAVLGRSAVARGLNELADHWVEIERIRAQYPASFVHLDALIQGWRPERLSLGTGCRIEKGTVVALGDELNGFGAMLIGNRTWIGQYCNFRLAADCRIEIGSGCLISQFCSIVAANHSLGRQAPMIDQPADHTRTGVRLGNDVWIGAGAAVLPSVTIGNGAVVGAGSVVTHPIPDHEIWAGVPARKIADRP